MKNVNILEAAQKASKAWQDCFNAGDATGCANQYEENALMEAKPFGTFKGRLNIMTFWQKIMDDGFADVEYIKPQFKILNKKSVILRSDWRMNKASGVIHKELWVIQNDCTAKLREDYFEVIDTELGA